MSAHSRLLNTTCDDRFCNARATQEVFNAYNSSLGKFCTRHARLRVKELQTGEAGER